MSYTLILRSTTVGERAFEILQKDADKMVKDGKAERLPDGVYRELETPKKKRSYKRKDVKAED